MSPELRPLVEAAYAELERQGGETGHLVNREGVRGTTIELMGDFDLAPLVEAVLAAQWRPLTVADVGRIAGRCIELWRPDGASGWDPYPGGGSCRLFVFDIGAVWTPQIAVEEFMRQGVTHFRFPTPPPKDPPATA